MEKTNYMARIPSEVRYDKRLRPNEKLLFAEISSCIDNDKICRKTNRYFAELYGVDISSISLRIQHLIKYWYLEVNMIYKEDWKEVEERQLKITYWTPYTKTEYPPIQKQKDNIIYKYIYNYNDIESKYNDDNKQLFKNELYILSKMFDLWMEIRYDSSKYTDIKICEIYVKRVKEMMSRYIPRKEDWKLDRNKAKAETDDWYIYWKNPPKWKKSPTNFQLSLTNWMKPKQRKK